MSRLRARAGERKRGRAGVTSALLLEACLLSGGSCSSPTTKEEPVPVAHVACPDALPALPKVPKGALRVTDFGARGDDDADDSRAILAALKALQPGGFLVFPRGRYLHDRSIDVTVSFATLWGEEGAVLHATDPAHQAIFLKADGASVYNLTLTAVTAARLTTPDASRLVLSSPQPGKQLVRGNTLRNNRLVAADPAVPALANSSSSAAIFVFGASDFLIAENRVERSLSDGIHITEGSKRGVVVGNTVRQTGDDMIAVVSYCDLASKIVASPSALTAMLAASVVSDVIVAHNDVGDQYWGRGLSVVGGDRITIEHNTVRRTPYAAGILVARESGYQTCGAHDVVVRDNVVSEVQTARPGYEPRAYVPDRTLTGHAAIEVHALVSAAERNDARLAKIVDVGPVSISGNTVSDARFSGLRAGDEDAPHFVHDLSVSDNRFMRVGQPALSVTAGVTYNALDNRLEQQPIRDRDDTVLKASGSSRSCQQALLAR